MRLDRLIGAGLVAASIALPTIMLPSAARADGFTMWVRSDGANFLPHLIDSFNQSHKDQVKLEIIPTAQVVQKYATAIAAGNAPDALSLDLIYTPAFASAGELQDLTAWAKSLPYFKALSPSHIKTGTYKGRIYGVPFSAEASVLFWNKKLFKQAGLDPNTPPKTWAEIEADAEKINALGNGIHGFYFSGACGGCNIFTFTPLIWASGGDILSADGTKATLDTPLMHDAVNFYRDMIKKGLVPASAQTDSGTDFITFASGKIGIESMGAFALGILTTQHPDVDFGVSFIPGKTGGWSSFAGGDNFVVTKGTKKLKVIHEFLDYAWSLKGQTILAQYGSLPVRTDLVKAALKGLDPRYAVPAEAMQKGRTPYSVVFNDIINSLNSPWTQMITAATFGNDPDGAIKNGQEQMQSIIDQAQD